MTNDTNDAIAKLREAHGGLYGEHPMYPVAEWKAHVANDETRLGYWEAVHAMLEEDVERCGECGDAIGDAEMARDGRCDACSAQGER